MRTSFSVNDMTIHRIVEQEAGFTPMLDFLPTLSKETLGDETSDRRLADSRCPTRHRCDLAVEPSHLRRPSLRCVVRILRPGLKGMQPVKTTVRMQLSNGAVRHRLKAGLR